MSKWHKGRVQWFDKSSGEGVVLGNDGETYHVHYSTIVPNAGHTPTLQAKNSQRRNLDAGAEVKFQIYENAYSKCVEKVKEA